MYPLENHQKYSIPNFNDFKNTFVFSDVASKHAAQTAYDYYRYAYSQMIVYSDAYRKFFHETLPNEQDNSKVQPYLYEAWSYAYGMYAQLRTVLEAIRIIRIKIGDTRDVGSYYDTEIKRIIDIANDIIKHPTFKNTTDPNDHSFAYEPVSLDHAGGIDVIKWSNDGTHSKIEIDPMKDFMIVHNYLEQIGENLNSVPTP